MKKKDPHPISTVSILNRTEIYKPKETVFKFDFPIYFKRELEYGSQA